MPNRAGHKCFIVWAISSCLEMEEWRLYSQVFKQEEKRDALWPRISVGKSITCPPGFSPWEVKGGIGDFRPFIRGAWIYRKWSSQNLDWKMNNLRDQEELVCFLPGWGLMGNQKREKTDVCHLGTSLTKIYSRVSWGLTAWEFGFRWALHRDNQLTDLEGEAFCLFQV